ncbi:MAG: FkbM family methyltransferase, partial [Candidatus Cloacimonetes bacterium]|nr:FkbM family methyltransferase [Candidatus Cloacimonadota bacterium]
MSILKKAFLLISGNRAIQGAIEKKVQSLQELMGIGSGDGVLSSGEQAVFDILWRKFKPPYCIDRK